MHWLPMSRFSHLSPLETEREKLNTPEQTGGHLDLSLSLSSSFSLFFFSLLLSYTHSVFHFFSPPPPCLPHFSLLPFYLILSPLTLSLSGGYQSRLLWWRLGCRWSCWRQMALYRWRPGLSMTTAESRKWHIQPSGERFIWTGHTHTWKSKKNKRARTGSFQSVASQVYLFWFFFLLYLLLVV